MERGAIGVYQITNTGEENVHAFVPHPLPPKPLLQMDGTLNQALAEAEKLEKQERRVDSLLRVHEALANQPILSLTGIRKMTGLSFPAASAAMDILVQQSVAREFTGRRRARLFAYTEYLATLNEETEVL